MPKLGSPLMSESAHGQIAKTMIFSDWKKTKRMKIYKKPINRRTPDQQENRSYMIEAVAAWKTLTNEEKLIWEGWKI